MQPSKTVPLRALFVKQRKSFSVKSMLVSEICLESLKQRFSTANNKQFKSCMKSVQLRSFSGLYFPVFGLNTEIYSVILHIQSKNGKIWTIKNSLFGPFSHSNSNHWDIILSILLCVIVNIFRKLFGKIFRTVIIKTSLRACFFFFYFHP